MGEHERPPYGHRHRGRRPAPLPDVSTRDLIRDGFVSPAWSEDENVEGIDAALALSALDGLPIRLRGGTEPIWTRTIWLPPAPITFYGDNPITALLATTDGTLLTFDPSTVGEYGPDDPWSSASSCLLSPVHYRSKVRHIFGLGFTKGDNWSGNQGTLVDFPSWTCSGYDKLGIWMHDCIVTNANGGGIRCLVAGLCGSCYFDRLQVDGCAGVGVVFGSDQRWNMVESSNTGCEGYWTDRQNGQLHLCKAYNTGKVDGHRGAGFHVEGGGGPTLTNCHGQDCGGPALELVGATGATVAAFKADRNCWNGRVFDPAKQAAAVISNSHHCDVSGLSSTDSDTSGSKTNPQAHALRVVGDANTGNRVVLKHWQTKGGPVVGAPIDPASNLTGTRVIVGSA